jgi:DNA-binding response OmpR family regulator
MLTLSSVVRAAHQVPPERAISRIVAVASMGQTRISRCDGSRELFIEHPRVRFTIKFTPSEYRLLLALLPGKPQSDRQLLGSLPLDRGTREHLDKHIDNVRAKLRCLGLGISVGRITGYGYILLFNARADEWTIDEPDQ